MSRFDKQTAEETFDDFTAVGIAEGFIECDSDEKRQKAWQHLENSGLGRSLQGWFGRTADAMIRNGQLKPKTT